MILIIKLRMIFIMGRTSITFKPKLRKNSAASRESKYRFGRNLITDRSLEDGFVCGTFLISHAEL